jgi:polyhydroxyalkanoate synthesis regulator phasin
MNSALDKLEERFAIGEIGQDLYQKYTQKFSDELIQQIDNSQSQIEQLMQSCLKQVFEQESNLLSIYCQ